MYSLKRKIVMLIVVSLWIYIAFIRPFKNELPLINEDDYMKPGSLDLPNVVVHLDLQGMPPRIPYLLEFLDRIRPIGANGLLIEYGDTYPFDGFIKYMSAEEAYNEEELTQFLKEANHKGFNVIPFVDTLVHLDLALEDFRHSREPGSTDSICPTESQSTAILTNLLEQIINFHAIIPLEYIHIGCGKEKLNYLKACTGRSRSDLDVYINHVRTVSNIIKSLKLDVKILMWDDIFRYISIEDDVKAKKLHDVEIVCRDYNPKIKVSFKTLLTYQKVFKNTWAASAYRGADGPDFKIPKLISRYQNNLAWMKLVNTYKDTYKFKGIILSGSHKHTECEILPAALPSLIMNLILIKQIMIVDDEARNMKALEFFDMFVQKDLKIALKCQDPIPFELTYQSMERCTFEEHTLVSSFLCYDLKDEDITNLFNMINHDYSTLFNNMFNYNTFLFLHHCLKEYKLKSYILNLTSQLVSYFGTRKNTYNCIQYLIDKVSKERSIWNMNNS